MCISHVCVSSLVQSMKIYLQWLRIPTCVEWCRGITFDLVCVTIKTAVTDFAFCFVCIASVSAHVGFQVFVYPANEVDYRPEPNMLKLYQLAIASCTSQKFIHYSYYIIGYLSFSYCSIDIQRDMDLIHICWCSFV